MKVLWFCNTSSNFNRGTSSSAYNGGGWVSSLEDVMKGRVELGIAFLTRNRSEVEGNDALSRGKAGRATWAEYERDGVHYFPIFNGYDITRGDRIHSLLLGDCLKERRLLRIYSRIVGSFSPDIIQVFGSEHSFGLVAGRTDIPVVLHIQGIMNPYWKVYLPSWTSWRKYIFTPATFSSSLQKFYTMVRWKRACRREKRILSLVRYYIGRTAWDREVVSGMAPRFEYFEGWEVLRPPFYESLPQEREPGSRVTLVSTISDPPYKGLDVVMRAASILGTAGVDFTWKVFGDVKAEFFETSLDLRLTDLGVELCGVVGPERLRDELLSCDIYVHPSYIDNSPNSVCEAQMLGVPVLAAAVGGVPSLIEDRKTGFFFPSGDAMELADVILHLLHDSPPGYLSRLGQDEREMALSRHDRAKIAENLLGTYSSIISRKDS